MKLSDYKPLIKSIDHLLHDYEAWEDLPYESKLILCAHALGATRNEGFPPLLDKRKSNSSRQESIERMIVRHFAADIEEIYEERRNILYQIQWRRSA